MSFSRKQFRDMQDIMKDFLPTNADVRTCSDSVFGKFYKRTDEGFDLSVVEVSPNEDSTYTVHVEDSGRDCDGYVSSKNTFTVRRRTSRGRIYPLAYGNRKGEFKVKAKFVIIGRGEASVYDQFADSMNY